jgi:hypothetical protein
MEIHKGAIFDRLMIEYLFNSRQEQDLGAIYRKRIKHLIRIKF